jgi:acyl-CoA synthetase (AMP-forming)/AMP-acid ligase II
VDEVQDGLTIAAIFADAVASHGDRPVFVVPANSTRSYLPDGLEITYAGAADRIAELTAIYRAAGYGLGHRVATLLENRPEYVLHKFALNAIGVC